MPNKTYGNGEESLSWIWIKSILIGMVGFIVLSIFFPELEIKTMFAILVIPILLGIINSNSYFRKRDK